LGRFESLSAQSEALLEFAESHWGLPISLPVGISVAS